MQGIQVACISVTAAHSQAPSAIRDQLRLRVQLVSALNFATVGDGIAFGQPVPWAPGGGPKFTMNLAPPEESCGDMVDFNATDPVVILGFNQTGQVLANFLSTPLASGLDGNFEGWPYVAFELDLSIVKFYSRLESLHQKLS